MRALVTELKKKKYSIVESAPARAPDSDPPDALARTASTTRAERTSANAL
jgi:hypothetical protein